VAGKHQDISYFDCLNRLSPLVAFLEQTGAPPIRRMGSASSHGFCQPAGIFATLRSAKTIRDALCDGDHRVRLARCDLVPQALG
jgi:hypothetical protein